MTIAYACTVRPRPSRFEGTRSGDSFCGIVLVRCPWQMHIVCGRNHDNATTKIDHHIGGWVLETVRRSDEHVAVLF